MSAQKTHVFIRIVCIVLFFFSPFTTGTAGNFHDRSFKDKWFQGQAEISRYALKQSRYGRIHEGEAVLVFVTEDFLPEKQVKMEWGDRGNSVLVMKLNFLRGFNTGIYTYSAMTSIFTPIGLKRTPSLKNATSVQEWCGQTYTQANYRQGRYEITSHSYFQNEADQRMKLPMPAEAWMEDEIWTAIRLYPDALPEGDVDVAPGFQVARFWHLEGKLEKATAEKTAADKDGTAVFRLKYKNISRDLKIHYAAAFPHDILSWTETETTSEGKTLTTEARRTHHIMTDYWNHNQPEDAALRSQLGLK
jgi:hypothetical protein